MTALTNKILILFALLPIMGYSQEEPEAKLIKERADFVDSIPFVVVNASEPQWTISNYLTGSHFVYAFENDSLYEDIRIQQWMKESKVSTIRWPGGTVVQYYHWDDLNGIPFSNDSWNPEYNEEKRPEHEYMDLDEYIAFCRKVEAEPMVGLNIKSGKQFNMLERSLDEARRLITYCKENGYDVNYWYIGNEGYAKGFSAKEYAEYIDMYAEVLKRVDPDIKIVVDWKFGPYKKNRFQESVEVAKAAKNIDVMEFHEKWGNIWGLKSGHTMDDWHHEFPLYDGKLSVLIQRFKDEMRKANKDVKVGFNEWGLGEIEDATAFDYALVAADFMIEMFKNDVYQACYWNLNMGEQASRVLKTDSSGTQLLQLNPIADVFKMFSSTLSKEYLYLDCTEKYIYGFGAKDQQTGDIMLYLLNKSTKETPVKLGVFGLGFDNADVKVELFSKPGTITSKEFSNVDIDNKEVVLDPSSLCKITIGPM